MNKFSVLISVYNGDNPLYLALSLDSIFNQTLLPSEVVIVLDGKLESSLLSIINDRFVSEFTTVKIVQLDRNYGLGTALKIGLEHCENEIIARMDSDDISKGNRFAIQYNFMLNRPEISVVGSNVEEFINSPGDLGRYRILPLDNLSISKFSRLRNPLNHPSVMFRKSHIEAVGSYKQMLFFEDYYLWLRVLKNGYKIANLKEILLYFRVDKSVVARRYGTYYRKNERDFLLKIYRENLISFFDFMRSFVIRSILRLLPVFFLSKIYFKFLRKNSF